MILEIPNVTNHMTLNSEMDHNLKLVYDNYCKDQQVWQYYNCDYITYMTNIIDELIGKVNQDITDCTIPMMRTLMSKWLNKTYIVI